MYRGITTLTRSAAGRHVSTVRPAVGAAVQVRSLHATRPTLKKRKNTIAEDAFEEDDYTSGFGNDADDLFDVSSLPQSSSSDPSASRADLVAELRRTIQLSPAERKRVVSSELKKNTLGRIVELSATTAASRAGDGEGETEAAGSKSAERDVLELQGVLRAWRMLGCVVRPEVAEAVVDKCIAVGRPDLAQTYSSDRIQYGLPPLDADTVQRLSDALASYKSADGGAGSVATGVAEPSA